MFCRGARKLVNLQLSVTTCNTLFTVSYVALHGPDIVFDAMVCVCLQLKHLSHSYF